MSKRGRRKHLKRSGFEDDIAKHLDERGIRHEYETWELEYYKKIHGAVVWDTEVNHQYRGKRFEAWAKRKYTPDFIIGAWCRASSDRNLFIEAKGRLTPATRTKMLAVRDQHPDLDIKFMFYRKEKIKLKRTPYNTDWAEAHGFDYVIGTEVPEEWL